MTRRKSSPGRSSSLAGKSSVRGRASRKAKQLPLGLKFRGGRRKNAGRKNRSGLSAHLKRPEFSARHPLHITLRLREGLPDLRRKDLHRILRKAIEHARLFGMRIVHYSIQSNHIHLLVEANDATELESMFKSFGTCFARRLNGLLAREGGVFHGRYHLHVLKTPREVRNALRYVLLNEEKHGGRPTVLSANTSATLFRDWDKLLDDYWMRPIKAANAPPSEAARAICVEPRSWLMRVGWMRA